MNAVRGHSLRGLWDCVESLVMSKGQAAVADVSVEQATLALVIMYITHTLTYSAVQHSRLHISF